MRRAYIPRRRHVHSTSDVDGVNTALGYWGPLSYPMRARLHMVVRSLERRRGFARILDAGYGGGILLPDLYRRLGPGGHLFGVDVHGEHRGVYERLVGGEGMDRHRVHLLQASLAALPFPDAWFDLVVSVSVLEHIPPALLPACLGEIRRVARPGAQIALGFPTDGWFIRVLSWVQGNDLKANHPSTHRDILRTIRAGGLRILEERHFPCLSRGPLVMHYNVRVAPPEAPVGGAHGSVEARGKGEGT
ncbi:MAG: class I SAM-dependent methyltransferase [Candidatus Latescibacterota bacterium]